MIENLNRIDRQIAKLGGQSPAISQFREIAYGLINEYNDRSPSEPRIEADMDMAAMVLDPVDGRDGFIARRPGLRLSMGINFPVYAIEGCIWRDQDSEKFQIPIDVNLNMYPAVQEGFERTFGPLPSA